MDSLLGRYLTHYHILEQLGQGGMAVVYRACDTRSGQDVAFKIIRSESFAPDVISRIQHRFKREVQTLMRLSHPNIVQILDSGEHEGSPYMVMPLLPGGTLKQKLGSPVPYEQAAGILLPIARALAHAHENHVIHRDVKPSNILFSAEGRPMLTDFGVVKIIENTESQTLTGTGVGIGTPEYMSPEQGMGKEVDGRSDIYALGVVFYELVTGRKPFIADTPMATVIMHINNPLPRPRQFVAGLPSDVEKLIFKALAKKSQDRYQNMSELTVALDKLIPRAKPVPPPRVEKVVKVKPPRVKTAKPHPEKKKPVREEKADLTTDVREVLPKPSPRKRAFPKALIGVGITVLGGLLLTGAVLMLSNPSAASLIMPAPSATFLPSTPTVTVEPTLTLTPTPTFTITPTQVYVLPADYVPTTKVTADGMTMILIPSIYGEPAFWIDQTEVTCEMYRKCEETGACRWNDNITIVESNVFPYDEKYLFSGHGDFPFTGITYLQAEEYCLWAGKGLPTEIQWEIAAGGYDGRLYPWGDEIHTSGYANIMSGNNAQVNYPITVGMLPLGASPFGVQDMIGNAAEWVGELKSNPNYSAKIKGGSAGGNIDSWTINDYEWITWYFNKTALYVFSAGKEYGFTGFRCVMSVDE